MARQPIQITLRGQTEVRRKIRSLAQRVANRTILFKRMGVKLLSETNKNFRNEGREGKPWKELADSTKDARRKDGSTGKILRDTGKLQQSVITKADPTKVVIGTNVAYAPYHQFGTKPYTILPKTKNALFWPGAAHPVPKVDHPGLSPRPFLPSTKRGLEIGIEVAEFYIVDSIKSAKL